ncbi:MAG TPA: hypothetical protein VES01_07595 [Dermatophilaceae bacterium]|nr:hypothetical protein [Dermatophilaceae bacterium]
MALVLDYAMKTHDAQMSYASKGNDYIVMAVEQASSMIDMAPKAPEFVIKALKPVVDVFGTPADVMSFAMKATSDWTTSITDLQSQLAEVVESSRVERLADRAKVADLHVVDDVKDAVTKVRHEAMDAMDKVSLETKDVAAKMRRDAARIRHDALDAVDKVTHDAKDAASKVRFDAAKMRHDAMDAVDKVAHDAKAIPSRVRRVPEKAEDQVEAAV